MEKSRKMNKIIVALLLVLIAGLSIGFAAFDRDLTIRTGGTVSPNPDGFAVVFSTSADSSVGGAVVTDDTGYAQAKTIDANTTTIEGLTANLTEPGQKATWTFYSYNSGKYDAYLNDITIGDVSYEIKQNTSTDEEKVKEAIKGIKVSVTVTDDDGRDTEYTTTDTDISGHVLPEGEGQKVVVTLEYEAGSAIADGDFNVTVEDIVLGYDSIETGTAAQ